MSQRKYKKPRELTEGELKAAEWELESPITNDEKQAAKNNINKPAGTSTICGHIRLLYLRVKDDGDSKDLCLRILAYAKRMNSALRSRNSEYDRGWYNTDEDK